MFKSLIATCLLTFSCSGAPRQEVPQEENNEMTLNVPMLANNNNNNYLFGSYCLNEFIDWATFNSIVGNNVVQYEFPSTFKFLSFVNYETHVNDFCEMSFEADYFDLYYTFELTNEYHYYYARTNEDFSDEALHVYLYVSEPYYPSNDLVIPLFNLVFTQEGNTYNEIYTGWYTFAQVPNFTNVSSCTIFGSILASNFLCNEITILSSNNKIQIYNLDSQQVFYIYDNGVWVSRDSNRNVYFTGCMINIYVKQNYSSIGVFSFVPSDLHQYTFGELIFNIMDAPIYFLSNLFSFELFGVQFYVAFMSIVTLVLICFVLRKII